MANTQQMASAIRALAMDAVQQANSGHPGAPMGMADMAVALWGDHLRHNPKNPHWINRDRFVLSNGHGSMLIYALLHLTGYDLPMSELKNFRTLHSKTAGHPEVGVTPGVETTTGPLGQGITNAVGMALAVKLLAIIGLTLAGGILLLWVCWRFWRDIRAGGQHDAPKVDAKASVRQAILQILVADLSMSLDNVLAVAGAARDHIDVLIIGLLMSVALMGAAANYIAKLLERYRWISYIGLVIVLYVALNMIWHGWTEVAKAI